MLHNLIAKLNVHLARLNIRLKYITITSIHVNQCARKIIVSPSLSRAAVTQEEGRSLESQLVDHRPTMFAQ
jgi:hypothetical protein